MENDLTTAAERALAEAVSDGYMTGAESVALGLGFGDDGKPLEGNVRTNPDGSVDFIDPQGRVLSSKPSLRPTAQAARPVGPMQDIRRVGMNGYFKLKGQGGPTLVRGATVKAESPTAQPRNYTPVRVGTAVVSARMAALRPNSTVKTIARLGPEQAEDPFAPVDEFGRKVEAAQTPEPQIETKPQDHPVPKIAAPKKKPALIPGMSMAPRPSWAADDE